jgi:hypothetical protein
VPRYDKYRAWVSENATWVGVLNRLRHHPRGFSFERESEVAEPDLTRYPVTMTNYLARSRRAEAAATKDERAEYEQLRARFEKGMAAYLEIGEAFLREVCDPALTDRDKHDLLVDAQGQDHLLHNAAVLWLEKRSTADGPGLPRAADPALDDLQDYEEVLKTLWAEELRAADPGWNARRPTPRQRALVRYCIGRDEVEWFPRWNDPGLDQVRSGAHVTLGKVLLRGRRVDLLQGRWVHPAYWGLFLVSPLFAADRGFYSPDPGDPDDRWVRRLAAGPTAPVPGFGLADDHFRHDPTRFQVYEKVPRLYADPASTPAGTYLHRSKAHGRDDFMAAVAGAGTQSSPRSTIVYCTKGVGADPDLIGSPTARQHNHAKALQERWAAPTTQYPFAYPGDDTADTAGSWRNLGFCLAHGGDEVAAVDFDNFDAMLGRAQLRNGRSDHGFVVPVACVEMNRLPRTVDRIKGLHTGLGTGGIGYPAQIVTGSPVETSLRLTKTGSGQDYDYGSPRLELVEWERCYAPVPLPGRFVQDVETDRAWLGTVITKYVADNGGDWGRVVGYPQAELADRLDFLARRMRLALRVVRRAFAAWQTFLDFGWATDSYTGSFAGRNFNSGPRDSNEWGPLARPSEGQIPGTSAGEGYLCAHVDIGNFRGTFGALGEMYGALGLLAGPQYGVDDGETGANSLYDARLMWPKCTVDKVAAAVTVVTRAVEGELKEMAGKDGSNLGGADAASRIGERLHAMITPAPGGSAGAAPKALDKVDALVAQLLAHGS